MQIYSGADGVIYEYLQSVQKQSLPNELGQMTGRHEALAGNRFGAEIEKWECDQCPVRVVCPHWIGVIPE
jgi:hypothetical protein